MKKVAATSGHRVSLAALVFAFGIAREGSWAGSDNVLNFYSRSSWSECSLVPNGATSQTQNTRFVPPRKKKMHLRQTFFDAKGTPGTRLSFSSPAPADNKPAFPPVLHSARLFSVHLRSSSLSTMKREPFLPSVIPPFRLPSV